MRATMFQADNHGAPVQTHVDHCATTPGDVDCVLAIEHGRDWFTLHVSHPDVLIELGTEITRRASALKKAMGL